MSWINTRRTELENDRLYPEVDENQRTAVVLFDPIGVSDDFELFEKSFKFIYDT